MPLNAQFCPDRVPDQGEAVERRVPESVEREIADREAWEAARAAMKKPSELAPIGSSADFRAELSRQFDTLTGIEQVFLRDLTAAIAALEEIHRTGGEAGCKRIMTDGDHSEHAYCIAERVLGL